MNEKNLELTVKIHNRIRKVNQLLDEVQEIHHHSRRHHFLEQTEALKKLLPTLQEAISEISQSVEIQREYIVNRGQRWLNVPGENAKMKRRDLA